jgi:hypothetical protein
VSLVVEALERRDLLASAPSLIGALPLTLGPWQQLGPIQSGSSSTMLQPALFGGTKGQHARAVHVAKPQISHTIVDFVAVEEGSNIWTFKGKVTGPDVVGLTVSFGGLPSVRGKTAVVEENGWFFLTVRLRRGESGTVTAQTTDSNMAETIVCPTGPR